MKKGIISTNSEHIQIMYIIIPIKYGIQSTIIENKKFWDI